MEENVARSMNQPRFVTLLLSSIFAGVALALAAVGTYDVLSYSVAERRKEIGTRMPLGAEAPRESPISTSRRSSPRRSCSGSSPS